jgi:shikimate 5-dehydrogenase
MPASSWRPREGAAKIYARERLDARRVLVLGAGGRGTCAAVAALAQCKGADIMSRPAPRSG